MTKGRRVGFTHGACNFMPTKMLEGDKKFLWVDTIYSNIDRYYERYLLPNLKQLPSDLWEWKKQSKELRVGDSHCDFRSADRPESIEGFGYTDIIINEAGIILKGERGRYIWQNAILPMTMDYPCTLYIGGTPKGKLGKDGLPTTYYELFQKAESGHKNYQHVNIPTFKSPFINREAVKEVYEELIVKSVRDQEFWGKFVEGGGGIVDSAWFQYTDLPLQGDRVRSWDLNATIKKSSDYAAGALCCFDGEVFQVQDMKQVKLLWPDLKELIMTTAEVDGQNVTIVMESQGQQNIAISDLQAEKRMMGYTIIAFSAEGDKLTRAMNWICRMQTSRLTWLRGAWNTPFSAEAGAFTADDTHAHDDQIDAVSQAWSYFCQPSIGAYIL